MIMFLFFMRMQMAMLPFHGFMLMIVMPVSMIMPVFVFHRFVNMDMNMPLAYCKICPRRHYN